MLRRRILFNPAEGIDTNTLMLFHFENTLNATSTLGQVITSNAMFNSSDKKFGGYSIYNSDPTTGSAFELPYSFINYLTSDFTIDFWVKPWQEIPENYSTAFLYLGADPEEVNYPYIMLYMHSADGSYSPYIAVDMYDSSNNKSSYRYKALDTYPTTWCHVALVRSNSQLYLFLNGELMFTPGDDSPAITISPIARQTVCKVLPYSDSGIDELRISNIARWTANFTPPTEPYA